MGNPEVILLSLREVSLSVSSPAHRQKHRHTENPVLRLVDECIALLVPVKNHFGCRFLVRMGHLALSDYDVASATVFAAASGLGAQQRLFDVLRRHGQDLVWQYCVGAAATYEANVAEILPTVSFESFDLRFIVGGYEPVPVQPELATVRHRIRDLDVHNLCSLPVAAPPGCRVQAPQIVRPPTAKMFRNKAVDFLHEASPGDADSSARPHESGEVVEVQIVGPVVIEGIKRHDDVEEFVAEG